MTEGGRGAAAAASRHDFDASKLSLWMSDNVPGFAGPVNLVKFPGGQSNPTYKLVAADSAYVLRRKPFGQLLPSAHAVEREHRVISALHAMGFPVPRPFSLCEDPDVIGSVFYVMELVQGRTIWDGALPGMSPEERTQHYHGMIDVLAQLHSVAPAAVGLESFGRPGNYFGRQVNRWTAQYRITATEEMPAIERLIEWLPRTVPPQSTTAIVHGDFRIDNMIFDPSAPRVAALLDWELSTLGDPLADLSYFLMNWETKPEGRAGIKGLPGPGTGIPSLPAMVDRYCTATGRGGIPDLEWYFAYSLFRLTVILQGIKKRMMDGNASSDRAGDAAARIPGLADAAWEWAARAGA